jgi:hypothetical protein
MKSKQLCFETLNRFEPKEYGVAQSDPAVFPAELAAGFLDRYKIAPEGRISSSRLCSRPVKVTK